jgi:hypothetical protein
MWSVPLCVVTIVTTVESIKHNTYIILKCDQGWLHVSALQEAIIRPSVRQQFIKSKTYKMVAHYGIPCGFTKLVMDTLDLS